MMDAASKPRKRVLCVDDEPGVRDLLAVFLGRLECDVETAADGAEAWRLISSDPKKYDLIVTDNQMPCLCGIDLVERLHATGYPGAVIFFSSSLTAPAAERVIGLGVDAVVEKGRPISELMAAVTRALSP